MPPPNKATSKTKKAVDKEKEKDQPVYYAVRQGDKKLKNVLFISWQDARPWIHGVAKAEWKVFSSLKQSMEYLKRENPEEEEKEEDDKDPSSKKKTDNRKKDHPRLTFPPEVAALNPAAVLAEATLVTHKVMHPNKPLPDYLPTRATLPPPPKPKAKAAKPKDPPPPPPELPEEFKGLTEQEELYLELVDQAETARKDFARDIVEKEASIAPPILLSQAPNPAWMFWYDLVLKFHRKNGHAHVYCDALEKKEVELDADGNPKKKKRGRPRKIIIHKKGPADGSILGDFYPQVVTWIEKHRHLLQKQLKNDDIPVHPDKQAKLKAVGLKPMTETELQEWAVQEQAMRKKEDDQIAALHAIRGQVRKLEYYTTNPQPQEKVKPPKSPGSRERKIHVGWMRTFQKLKKFKEENNGSVDVPGRGETAKLRKWLDHQVAAYRLLQSDEDKKTSMSNAKAALLKELGVELDGEAYSTRKPAKTWEKMFARLKEYGEANDYNYDISREDGLKDEKLNEIRLFIMEQQSQYRRLRDGESTTMSREKVRRLESIQLPLQHTTFEEYIQQVKDFQQESGQTRIPSGTPLYKWLATVRSQAKRLDDGHGSRITREQVQILKDMGLYRSGEGRYIDPVEQEAEEKHWNEMYDKLVEFRKEHGHCQVNTSKNLQDPFVKWVIGLRRHYRLLRDGKTGGAKLTAARMARLHDVGFDLSKRKRYMNFEYRLQQLKDYKEQHGHTRPPISTPNGLGAFVSNCRKEYQRRLQGRPTSLKDDRVRALEEIGFEFVICPKRELVPLHLRKSWEERFQQLLEYKAEYGDTVVPQHFKGFDNLGRWVQTQRKAYRAMRNGKPSHMTPERALRLSDIGFVWDASYKIRKRAREETMAGANYAAGHAGYSSGEEHHSPQRKVARRSRLPVRPADDDDDVEESSDEEEDHPRRFY